MEQFTVRLTEEDAAIYRRAAARANCSVEEFLTESLQILILQSYLMRETPLDRYASEK